MKSRTVLALVVLAVAVAGAAWMFASPPASVSGTVEAERGTLMFPGLATKLAEASRVEITAKGRTLTIAREGADWGLPSRGGYPVDARRLRVLLTGLTLLRMDAPRTADPALLERLGLGNPESANSTANLVRVLDAKGNVLAALIVGHRRVYTEGGLPDSLYVRRPGQNQSWLAEGRLPVQPDAELWLRRTVTDIAPQDVASVAVHRGGSVLRFGRTGGKEALLEPSPAPALDPYRLDDVFRALQTLTLDDVKPAASAPGDPLGTARFTLTDGTTLTVSVFIPAEPVGKPLAAQTIWIQFAVGGTSPQARALARRLTGWSYQVGIWKQKAFVPMLADLVAQAAAPAAK